MRIFSKHRDCYDCFQENDDIVWSRDNSIEVNLQPADRKFVGELFDEFPKPIYRNVYQKPKRHSWSSDIDSKSFLLFMCGKVYPFYAKLFNTYSTPKYGVTFISQTPSDFKRKMAIHYNFTEDNWSLIYNKFDDKVFEDFKTHLHNNRDRIYKLFIDYKVPLLLVGGNHCSHYRNLDIILNPILKDYGIQKIIGPFTIYQEIKFFLSNDLVEEPMKDFQITDDLKRDSKGFDKWSFRRKVR